MRRGLLAGMVSGLALLAAAPAQVSDKDRLQGAWAFVSMEVDGRKVPPDQQVPHTLAFEGDKVSEKIEDVGPLRSKFVLNPKATPKRIDLPGFQTAGIYKLEGETLTLCVGRTRPAGFSTKAGSGATLLVYRRPAKR